MPLSLFTSNLSLPSKAGTTHPVLMTLLLGMGLPLACLVVEHGVSVVVGGGDVWPTARRIPVVSVPF
jgi:uncharacterized protein YraI